MRDRESVKLPDAYDIAGAAFGLVRLHSLYKLNATEMLENGVIATEKTATGENIRARSAPAVAIPSSYDALHIAEQSFKHGFYRTTVDAFPFIMAKLRREQELNQGNQRQTRRERQRIEGNCPIFLQQHIWQS